MVDSFLQCELKALPAVRVKPGAGQRSLLRDELKAPCTTRSLCPAAAPAAGRPCVLVTAEKFRSSATKVDREAGRFFRRAIRPFSETPGFTSFSPIPEWIIQAHDPPATSAQEAVQK